MHKAVFCAMITLLLENTSRKQSRNFWKPARSISCNTNMQQQQKQQQQQKAVTTTITDTPCNCMIDIFPNNQCNISYSFYQSQSSYLDRNHNKSKLLAHLIFIVSRQAAPLLKFLFKHLRDPLVRVCQVFTLYMIIKAIYLGNGNGQ